VHALSVACLASPQRPHGRVCDRREAGVGVRRFAARLGKVALVAALVAVIASLAAYQAEHATNSEFAAVGDALPWGIVTLTTVGYGDIVPHTTAGRFAGVMIMVTGIAVLGVLAGFARLALQHPRALPR
jgi:voltage-gated potassium channel Kch